MYTPDDEDQPTRLPADVKIWDTSLVVVVLPLVPVTAMVTGLRSFVRIIAGASPIVAGFAISSAHSSISESDSLSPEQTDWLTNPAMRPANALRCHENTRAICPAVSRGSSVISGRGKPSRSWILVIRST